MSNLAEDVKHYILTFGYGNRKDYDVFLGYLKKFDVSCVVDVRLSPRAWSRRWYGEKIEQLCSLNNIQYISNRSLGNISGGSNWIPANYEEAEKALLEVSKIAESCNILLLCGEMDSRRCHRVDVAHEIQKITNSQIKNLL